MLNRLVRFFMLLGLAFAWAGCATNAIAPAAARETAEVRLVIANPTNRAWRITVRLVDGSAARTAHVEAQGRAEFGLARGDYAIEQALLGADSSVLAQRDFQMRFPTAGDYRWELATLSSAEENRPTPAATSTGTASRD